jgi:hypothetical protein
MLYYDIVSQRQLAREPGEQLAAEMRRARRLTREEAGYPRRTRIAREMLGRAELPRGRKGSHHPAYHV